MTKNQGFSVGEQVVVRSREDILATLDAAGCVDGLPFMPEMLRFCGQTFRVASVAHKTCDTISRTGGRRMLRAVHLEGLRCDGSSHGGCQANCLTFWKEDWLERPGARGAQGGRGGCSEQQLYAATQRDAQGSNEPVYRCQATDLLAATQPLSAWDVRQYVADIRTGNATVGRAVRAFLFSIFHRIVQFGVGYRFLVGAYDALQRRIGGSPYPFRQGALPVGAPPPRETLNLQPGETVKAKPYEEILETLNTNNKNRGLWFDSEMVPYCGGTYRVLRRVDRIINESNGKMLQMKAPCIMLEGVVCRSLYSEKRLLCPRAIQSYWRESWLERAEPGTAEPRR